VVVCWGGVLGWGWGVGGGGVCYLGHLKEVSGGIGMKPVTSEVESTRKKGKNAQEKRES